MKDDLESLLEQIGFSSFLSLSRELSLFLLHEHVLSLLISKLLLVSLNSLYKFHVSCFVFSHFNSRPPLSLLLHFNCSLPADVLWGSFVTHSGGEVNAWQTNPKGRLRGGYFNCDLHGYLTRSRSTCIKCPSGINFYFGGARSEGFAIFWQDWACKVCRFSVLFGYLTKWEPN